MKIEKRIETATEVVTVDSNNVVHVTRKGINIPRNFSFAALHDKMPKLVVDEHYTLFINDVRLDVSTSFDHLQNLAWINTRGSDVNSVIIC